MYFLILTLTLIWEQGIMTRQFERAGLRATLLVETLWSLTVLLDHGFVFHCLDLAIRELEILLFFVSLRRCTSQRESNTCHIPVHFQRWSWSLMSICTVCAIRSSRDSWCICIKWTSSLVVLAAIDQNAILLKQPLFFFWDCAPNLECWRNHFSDFHFEHWLENWIGHVLIYSMDLGR